GRLSLMQALAEGKLESTQSLKEHLDTCLHCLACEGLCPSNVAYGKSLNATKELWASTTKSNESFAKVPLSIDLIISTPKLIQYCRTAVYIYQKTKLNRAFKSLFAKTNLGRIESILPDIAKPVDLRTVAQAKINTKMKPVQLFLGCISQITDQKTSIDTIRLLQAFGYKVNIPQLQTCCGAMHLHAGHKIRYQDFLLQNQKAFDPKIPIIYSASGCGMHIAPDSHEVEEICEFLTKAIKTPTFKPLKANVLVHTPCTLKQHSTNPMAATNLLKHIPEIKLSTMKKDSCCGSAGLNMIKNPNLAENILDTLLHQELICPPNFLVTSNIGCSMHIVKHLKKQNKNISVVHPVTLLAQQLL
ncbi:MAG: (Fe-S)-binding protein, partial [Francisellaceae bacterium]|nr:(Fe-S)-binding protein [Francisellaceae bacterium]